MSAPTIWVRKMPQKPTTDTQLEVWQIEIIKDRFKMEKDLLTYLKCLFAIALGVTLLLLVVAVLLSGWSSKTGFAISDEIIKYLVGATVGEAAGLLGIAITAVLKQKTSTK